jgi:hypothetical protein
VGEAFSNLQSPIPNHGSSGFQATRRTSITFGMPARRASREESCSKSVTRTEKFIVTHPVAGYARQRIERLRLDHPLASQRLGAMVYEVEIAMLCDLDGWARLFRVKVIETA